MLLLGLWTLRFGRLFGIPGIWGALLVSMEISTGAHVETLVELAQTMEMVSETFNALLQRMEMPSQFCTSTLVAFLVRCLTCNFFCGFSNFLNSFIFLVCNGPVLTFLLFS